MSWSSASGQQSQGGTGNITFMKQEADHQLVVKAGDNIRSESNVWATQTGSGSGTTSALQQQATNAGAAVIYPWGLFPAQTTAQFMGNSAQAQTWNTNNPNLNQNSMIHQKARVDATEVFVDSNLGQNLQGSGFGNFNQQQANQGSGAAVGFAVPPFPKSHTLDFNLGNRQGLLFQQINLVNQLLFI